MAEAVSTILLAVGLLVVTLLVSIGDIAFPTDRPMSGNSAYNSYGSGAIVGNHEGANSNNGSGRPAGVPYTFKTEDLVRFHTEGIASLTMKTVIPLKVNVVAGFAQVVGSVELSTRVITQTEWELTFPGVDTNVHIWDERGRATLIPGTLVCRITHRATLAEYEMAGLSLGIVGGMPIPSGSLTYSGGGMFEQLDTNFFEQAQRCPVGPIPAQTTADDIEKLCEPCHKRVSKTLKEDVDSRMKALTYLVNTPLCKTDNECRQEDTYWTKGRCVLVKDKYDSIYSECQARSKIGGSCPGKGSSGMFEYRCDRGLKCTMVKKGRGFWTLGSYDYDDWECRDPKHPEWTKPR